MVGNRRDHPAFIGSAVIVHAHRQSDRRLIHHRHLNDGANTVHIRITDTAGNTTTETLALTIDTDAPAISSIAVTADGIESGGNEYLNAGDIISFTITVDENTPPVRPFSVQMKNNAANLGTAVATTRTVGSATEQTAQFTVSSGQTVSLGNLKYDITGESSLTDIAGNALPADNTAAKTDTQTATTSTYVIDTTTPTITVSSPNTAAAMSKNRFRDDPRPVSRCNISRKRALARHQPPRYRQARPPAHRCFTAESDNGKYVCFYGRGQRRQCRCRRLNTNRGD